jgi:hypothetical protein
MTTHNATGICGEYELTRRDFSSNKLGQQESERTSFSTISLLHHRSNLFFFSCTEAVWSDPVGDEWYHTSMVVWWYPPPYHTTIVTVKRVEKVSVRLSLSPLHTYHTISSQEGARGGAQQ